MQCLFGQLLQKLEWDQNFKMKEFSETKKYIKEYLQFGSSFNILKTEFSPISPLPNLCPSRWWYLLSLVNSS